MTSSAGLGRSLRSGADANGTFLLHEETPLMMCSRTGNIATVKMLLDKGAKVNVKSMPNNWERQVTAEPRMKILPPGSMTALHWADWRGFMPMRCWPATSGST